MKIIAVLDLVSEDDGMIVIKSGCTDGNGKEAVAVLNSKQCAPINNEQIKAIVQNWQLFVNSPEYPLIAMMFRELGR